MEQVLTGQLIPFITHHWALCLALLATLALISMNEYLAQRKRAKELSTGDAVHMMNHEQAVVFDLRDADAYRAGHIIDAIHASADDFSQKRMEKYKNKPLIFVCARGLQSSALAAKLRVAGFEKPLVLAGGFAAWTEASLPVVKKPNLKSTGKKHD